MFLTSNIYFKGFRHVGLQDIELPFIFKCLFPKVWLFYSFRHFFFFEFKVLKLKSIARKSTTSHRPWCIFGCIKDRVLKKVLFFFSIFNFVLFLLCIFAIHHQSSIINHNFPKFRFFPRKKNKIRYFLKWLLKDQFLIYSFDNSPFHHFGLQVKTPIFFLFQIRKLVGIVEEERVSRTL